MPMPYPLLGARAALARMTQGDILGLLLTDRESELSLAAWCRMTGNLLLGSTERLGVRCAVIKKGDGRCSNR